MLEKMHLEIDGTYIYPQNSKLQLNINNKLIKIPEDIYCFISTTVNFFDLNVKQTNMENIDVIYMSLVKLNNSYTDKNTTHNYLQLYETLLKPIKNTADNILEVGIGDLKSKMVVVYYYGQNILLKQLYTELIYYH